MIQCDKCGGSTAVKETRGKYRRRKCAKCGRTFRTVERPIGVVKRGQNTTSSDIPNGEH